MAQFDVYKNPNKETKKYIPYLLDIQSDVLSGLTTRVVVPLILVTEVKNLLRHINPKFDVENKKLVMSTAELVAIPGSLLDEKICSLASRRYEILAAVDFAVTGY